MTTTEISTVLEYRVDGMACGACKLAIREYVGHVPDVSDVEVDVRGGTVRVFGRGVRDVEVRAAIEEAGYTVTS